MSAQAIKVVFLDIDGVLNNRSCFVPGNSHPKYGRNPDPKCISALNSITERTGALIVISSTWRISGLMHMRETLAHWGVEAKVIGITPRLQAASGTLSIPRGAEIAAWMARYKEHGGIDSFVILDDDNDMVDLCHRLVRTSFDQGLSDGHARRAVTMLAASPKQEGPAA